MDFDSEATDTDDESHLGKMYLNIPRRVYVMFNVCPLKCEDNPSQFKPSKKLFEIATPPFQKVICSLVRLFPGMNCMTVCPHSAAAVGHALQALGLSADSVIKSGRGAVMQWMNEDGVIVCTVCHPSIHISHMVYQAVPLQDRNEIFTSFVATWGFVHPLNKRAVSELIRSVEKAPLNPKFDGLRIAHVCQAYNEDNLDSSYR